MIVSRQNQKIKDIRRLQRCKGDRALLEGPHLVFEALAAGITLEFALTTPQFMVGATGRRLLPDLPIEPIPVDPRLLDELCDADSPRGLVAVASLPRTGLEALSVSENGLYLFVDGMQDPGNLGALIRVAEAFSATGVVLSEGSVHPNHPRALRASAGSLLRVPIAVDVSVDELARFLAPISPRWLAMTPSDGRPLQHTEFVGSLVIAVGAEGPGLSAAVDRQADIRLTIPLEPPVESLNSTVAAAIVLYEIRRRR